MTFLHHVWNSWFKRHCQRVLTCVYVLMNPTKGKIENILSTPKSSFWIFLTRYLFPWDIAILTFIGCGLFRFIDVGLWNRYHILSFFWIFSFNIIRFIGLLGMKHDYNRNKSSRNDNFWIFWNGHLERLCLPQLVLKHTLQSSLEIMGKAAVHATGEWSRGGLTF